MTRQEFVDQLIENGINPDIVLFDFDNNVRDGYCIKKLFSLGSSGKGKRNGVLLHGFPVGE